MQWCKCHGLECRWHRGIASASALLGSPGMVLRAFCWARVMVSPAGDDPLLHLMPPTKTAGKPGFVPSCGPVTGTAHTLLGLRVKLPLALWNAGVLMQWRVGGGGRLTGGGGSFKPPFQTTSWGGSHDASPGRARRGWGGVGGLRGAPTYIPQNDRHDTLIILRYILSGKFFWFGRLCAPILRQAPVLRLPLCKGAAPPSPTG